MTILNVPGIAVGHATQADAKTGCTVLLPEQRSVIGVNIAGGSPGTREIALCQPDCFMERVDAILLCGGSAWGLAAADGVMRYLEERNRGFTTPHRLVPIVPAAVIYDLNRGTHIAPTAEDGYQACIDAETNTVVQGHVGAGVGALVGKFLGTEYASPGALGSASIELENGLVVGALVVLNAFGNVVNSKTGHIIAGACRNEKFIDAGAFILSPEKIYKGFGENTTLGIIATNAALTKTEASLLSKAAQNGIAVSTDPPQTQLDGDIVFTVGHGDIVGDFMQLQVAAKEVMVAAIQNAFSTV